MISQQEILENSEQYLARYGVGCHMCRWAEWSPERNGTRFFEGCGKEMAVVPVLPPAPAGTRRYALHSICHGKEKWTVTGAVSEAAVTALLERINALPGCAARAFSAGEIDLEGDGDSPWVAYDEGDYLHEVPEWVVAVLDGTASLPVACEGFQMPERVSADVDRMEIPPLLEQEIERWERGLASWSENNSLIRGLIRTTRGGLLPCGAECGAP